MSAFIFFFIFAAWNRDEFILRCAPFEYVLRVDYSVLMVSFGAFVISIPCEFSFFFLVVLKYININFICLH